MCIEQNALYTLNLTEAVMIGSPIYSIHHRCHFIFMLLNCEILFLLWKTIINLKN